MMPDIDLAEHPAVEKAQMLLRLGVLEGKLDTLLQLRKDDAVDLRALATEFRSTAQAVNELLRASSLQVGVLASDVKIFREGLASLSHIVRDSDTNSLVHRVARIEEGFESIRRTVDGDRKTFTAEMTALRDGIETDIKELRVEIRGFAADVARREDESMRKQLAREEEATRVLAAREEESIRVLAEREAQAALRLVERETEAVKERRAHSRNFMLVVATAIFGVAATLITALIQGAFSSHWK